MLKKYISGNGWKRYIIMLLFFAKTNFMRNKLWKSTHFIISSMVLLTLKNNIEKSTKTVM
jgi:hypothetical protein